MDNFLLGLSVIAACNFDYDLPQILIPGPNKIPIGFGIEQHSRGFPTFKRNGKKIQNFISSKQRIQ
jgi:hypothetical protein